MTDIPFKFGKKFECPQDGLYYFSCLLNGTKCFAQIPMKKGDIYTFPENSTNCSGSLVG